MSNGSWLEGTAPKTAFIFGIISGLAVAFIIGFFVMLSAAGGGIKLAFGKIATTGNNPSVSAPSPSPVAPAEPTNVTVQIKDNDHIRGKEDARLTIVEFSDFQCPFCERFYPTMKRVVDEYKDDVRLVYRHFPLDSIHPNARPAAEAAECASEQGKFWEYHDYLFENQNQFSAGVVGTNVWITFAKAVGLNESKFTDCVNKRKYKDRVEEDYQTGLSAGSRGTPYTIIGTTPISGALPYESIKQAVDQALQAS